MARGRDSHTQVERMSESIADQKRELIKRDIERNGLRLTRDGNVWRITGTHVNLVVRDLLDVNPRQLKPLYERRW